MYPVAGKFRLDYIVGLKRLKEMLFALLLGKFPGKRDLHMTISLNSAHTQALSFVRVSKSFFIIPNPGQGHHLAGLHYIVEGATPCLPTVC